MRPAGLIFDFDGVLIESEFEGNAHIARTLSALGHPTDVAVSIARFMGLSGPGLQAALSAWIGGPVPSAFHEARAIEDARALAEGVPAVTGAVAFVAALPPALPRAIASSSSTAWIGGHLDHLGLRTAFAPHIYSGKEHVTRGKPAPDLYLHAAAAIGCPIEACAIIEDSPVGVRGALASGARVIGLVAGTHCAPGHADALRAEGVQEIAPDFATVARLLALAP